jgi:hypothetical protein
MPRALADNTPLVLGSGGEHDGARHVGNPLESISAAMKATLRESRSSFATKQGGRTQIMNSRRNVPQRFASALEGSPTEAAH